MNIKKFALLLPLIFITLRVMDFVRIHFLPAFYVFDHVRLQEICQEALSSLDIDAPADKIMERTHELLKKEYPDHIANMRPEDWVFNNAGNAMGSMIILHASLTEYLIFFGSSVGTGHGHTGTHLADDYFTILHGVQYASRPNATIPEKYLPGDQHHLPYGENKQYSMPGGSFALELAQGYIPAMLPFGMIEVLTTTFDWHSFAHTVELTAKHMIGSLLMGKI